MRIVKLEETLELINEKNEDRLQDAELAYRQGLSDVKKGVADREKQLIEQVHVFKDRVQL